MVMGSIENNMNYMINKNKSNYTEKLFEIKNLDNEIIGNIKIGMTKEEIFLYQGTQMLDDDNLRF